MCTDSITCQLWLNEPNEQHVQKMAPQKKNLPKKTSSKKMSPQKKTVAKKTPAKKTAAKKAAPKKAALKKMDSSSPDLVDLLTTSAPVLDIWSASGSRPLPKEAVLDVAMGGTSEVVVENTFISWELDRLIHRLRHWTGSSTVSATVLDIIAASGSTPLPKEAVLDVAIGGAGETSASLQVKKPRRRLKMRRIWNRPFRLRPTRRKEKEKEEGFKASRLPTRRRIRSSLEECKEISEIEITATELKEDAQQMAAGVKENAHEVVAEVKDTLKELKEDAEEKVKEVLTGTSKEEEEDMTSAAEHIKKIAEEAKTLAKELKEEMVADAKEKVNDILTGSNNKEEEKEEDSGEMDIGWMEDPRYEVL